MPYATFTVDDFCNDPYFIQWVVHPTDESNQFWQAFMVDYPHKRETVQQAIDFVKTIQFQEIEPSELDLARLKQRIWADIDQPVRVVQWYRRPGWLAAAMVLITLASLGWWTYQATPTHQTAYGETKELKLADGSTVTLNANSSLKEGDNLADAAVREVWLSGEAYFSIAKRKGAKFIVHTADAAVEVLGTEFNVNTRRKQTNVVLLEGKVQLTTADQPAVVMKPGDMATVLPQRRQIQLKKVVPEAYEAWREAYLVLDGKSLPEIISTLEDTFGVTITLNNERLAGKTLSGKLRTKVADDCIEDLAIILEADVKKTGDTYLFE
ncbi:anti-FecI sigma factor, FecR [Fibrella aestuarina BUZ 2]|uniref:Anti-FecI sigma factor, FecR n=1 Tax=Fibrella aestuarina BUZ 2 TaxID=1166018 RepID=I0K8F3_9BACT|nr:FecR domain-containing protein [Fibrella aestuarina]CCH00406.1 anti-FecI sigma factor, FecR [Fibrella aestuarina BUZ 2]